MNLDERISDEQLNSLLDNELESEDKARLLQAINQDKELASRYCELRQIKDMVILTYADPPVPAKKSTTSWQSYYQKPILSTAAGVFLLVIGGLFGGLVSSQFPYQVPQVMTSLADFKVNEQNSHKVLLHISTMEGQNVNAVLDITEKLLKQTQKSNEPLRLEIVANANGLGVLRKGSPFTHRIRSIVANYNNVSFLACGIAKQNLSLKEGQQIVLIPEAVDIPAALDQILKRVGEGWTYVRG